VGAGARRGRQLLADDMRGVDALSSQRLDLEVLESGLALLRRPVLLLRHLLIDALRDGERRRIRRNGEGEGRRGRQLVVIPFSAARHQKATRTWRPVRTQLAQFAWPLHLIFLFGRQGKVGCLSAHCVCRARRTQTDEVVGIRPMRFWWRRRARAPSRVPVPAGGGVKEEER
jgi:hypothetical protein